MILFERQGSEGYWGTLNVQPPQAWKWNIKAMWYEVRLLISSSEKQIFEIVLLCYMTDKVRSGDRGGRDNLPGETDRLLDWVMSILTCNMTREYSTVPHWPTGWSTHLGWDEMRWDREQSIQVKVKNSTEFSRSAAGCIHQNQAWESLRWLLFFLYPAVPCTSWFF